MIEALLLSSPKSVHPLSFTQTRLADRPLAASHPACCYYDGKIYVYGGLNTAIVSTASFHVYDIATNTWSTLATPNSLRRSAVLWAVDGYVYLYGGWHQANNSAYATVFRYNIATNTWATTGFPSGLARSDAPYLTVGNLGYVFGGYSTGMIAQPQVLELTAGQTWDSSLAQRNTFRYSGIAKLGDDIFFVGGLNASNGQINQNVKYSLNGNTYSVLKNIPVVSHSANLMAIDQKIVAYLSSMDGVYGTGIYIYDPTLDAWQLEPFVGQIHGLASSVQVDNSLYIVGGFDGTTRTAALTRLDVTVG